MSAIVDREFDRNLRPRERNWGFPKIALRQRTADHPMIMFFLVAAAAFTAMAVMPPSGVAFASFGTTSSLNAPVKVAPPEEVDAPLSAGLSDIDIACHGQVWGAQSEQCLATISKESGRNGGRAVRVIAGA